MYWRIMAASRVVGAAFLLAAYRCRTFCAFFLLLAYVYTHTHAHTHARARTPLSVFASAWLSCCCSIPCTYPASSSVMMFGVRSNAARVMLSYSDIGYDVSHVSLSSLTMREYSLARAAVCPFNAAVMSCPCPCVLYGAVAVQPCYECCTIAS